MDIRHLGLPLEMTSDLLKRGVLRFSDLFLLSPPLPSTTVAEIRSIILSRLDPYPMINPDADADAGNARGKMGKLLMGFTPASLICRKVRPILTFAKAVDTMMAGGFPGSEICVLAGAPGTGKTQVAMQLSINAAIPRADGGVEGSTVFVDCEGSFDASRCQTMAVALHEHLSKVKIRNGQDPTKTVPTVESILAGIHVVRPESKGDLESTMAQLRNFCFDNRICLIVVDGIASTYRTMTDMSSRSRALSVVMSELAELATHLDLAVVVTNHMTTQGDENPRHVPALGEGFKYLSGWHVILENLGRQDGDGNQLRTWNLTKGTSRPPGEALFVIKEEGIRDARPL